MKNNPFPYSIDNKRYHTLFYHNRQQFGGRVYKAVLDAGAGCPNIDGRKSRGGCIFCSGGSGYFTAPETEPIAVQLEKELARIREKHPQARVIAYFQAHTNTYGPLERWAPLYEEALAQEGVAGLSIATRADCLEEDMLDHLAALAKRAYLTVELGLQTTSDETARRINRGHSLAEFLAGYEALQQRGIRTCVHIMDGLPGEGQRDMLETARVLGGLAPQGVKIHLLHVIEGTPLAEMYKNGLYTPMEKDAYVDTVGRQLELFPGETVMERLTGDGDKRFLLAPDWSRDKISVLGAIDRWQAEHGSWQGKALQRP